MLKNILKIALLAIALMSCTAVAIPSTPPVTDFDVEVTQRLFFLQNNPVDYYFDNEYALFNDSQSAMNDYAIAYANAWKAEMVYAYETVLATLSDDFNRELFIQSQQSFTDYVDSEMEFMRPFYGSNYIMEAYTFKADMYKSRCNKLYEYVDIIFGEIVFYYDNAELK
jgi:Uncharacterized protein conserved in bacteria